MQAYPFSIRLKAVRLHLEQKVPISQVSIQLNISRRSLKNWIKSYQTDGEAGLHHQYANSGNRASAFSSALLDKAYAYKREHSDWGAPFILLKLADDFPNQLLPKARWLQQLFHRADLQQKRDRLPRPKTDWAKAAFDRVQVDAKEKLKTANGQVCCYLNFTDEYTGSVLNAFLFSLW